MAASLQRKSVFFTIGHLPPPARQVSYGCDERRVFEIRRVAFHKVHVRRHDAIGMAETLQALPLLKTRVTSAQAQAFVFIGAPPFRRQAAPLVAHLAGRDGEVASVAQEYVPFLFHEERVRIWWTAHV